MTNSVGEKLGQQRKEKGNNWTGRIKEGLKSLSMGNIWENGSNN
jgi:hypothetical protein